jgi:hypothetical protein
VKLHKLRDGAANKGYSSIGRRWRSRIRDATKRSAVTLPTAGSDGTIGHHRC